MPNASRPPTCVTLTVKAEVVAVLEDPNVADRVLHCSEAGTYMCSLGGDCCSGGILTLPSPCVGPADDGRGAAARHGDAELVNLTVAQAVGRPRRRRRRTDRDRCRRHWVVQHESLEIQPELANIRGALPTPSG